MKTGFIKTQNPSRVPLSRVSILENAKEVAPSDNNLRGWTNAFTLIELLVVVLIIGILSAIALPQYRKAVMKSRFTQLKILVQSVVKAQELIYLENGSYTEELNALSISFPTPNSIMSENGDTTLTYDWGNCHFDTTQMSCKNDSIGMYYHAYYQHDYHTPKWECSALISNQAATNLCKQETGKTTPFWNSTEWAAYEY